jgi:hypothetical protein
MSDDHHTESFFAKREVIPVVKFQTSFESSETTPKQSGESGDLNLSYLDFVGRFETFLMANKGKEDM